MPQFLILANDYKDAEALQRRLSVRESHLQRMREERVKGKFILGGAKLDESGKMRGSMLLVDLENEEAAWKWTNQDPYVVGKVWEEITITSFRIADV
jgi:uncharacterized protein YciI